MRFPIHVATRANQRLEPTAESAAAQPRAVRPGEAIVSKSRIIERVKELESRMIQPFTYKKLPILSRTRSPVLRQIHERQNRRDEAKSRVAG